MEIQAIRTKIFKPNENLIDFIKKYISKISNGDVIIVTSKIVSYSEGRFVFPYTQKMRDQIIKNESSFVLRTKYTWLTIKDDMVMASAGVDESNADNKLILLPKDSFKTAFSLRKELMQYYKVKNLGIIITDSRLLPLRAGVVGVALGYSGFKGIRNYVGKHDIFGRELKFSRTDIADSLATSAVICMGEGNEQKPLAIIRNAPIEYTEKINKKELRIDPKEDLYAPLFRALK